MADKPTHDIRQLPIYRDDFAAGVDAGLVYAMSAITTERVRQERLGSRPDSGSQTCRAYADGALLAVARVLAGRFWQ